MNLKIKKLTGAALAAVIMTVSSALPIYADDCISKKTTIDLNIYPNGSYSNWDGVSNAAQFIDNKGYFCFAYDGEDSVTVVRVNSENNVLKKRIILEKQHPLFGTVICDDNGYYYLVTGESNDSDDTSKETVFITKYDSDGNILDSVGDNGSSSLAYYYGSSYYTKVPFDGGTCAAAVNGNLLTVNYARQMYSGHQSNSVIIIDTSTMEKLNAAEVYNSHSFSQRVIPFRNGFVYASEGDGFDRAFTINAYVDSKMSIASNSFHFWVEEGTYTKYDMYTLNNNFAHMGGLAALNDDLVALVGTSARSLNSDAENEPEDLFIQIFRAKTDSSAYLTNNFDETSAVAFKLDEASSFVTSGTRSGLGGINGDMEVTDYGVKWLTNSAKNKTRIKDPQIVSIGNDRAVILFEKSVLNENGYYDYKGVFYFIIDANGKIVQNVECFSKTAQLNSCVMPVYSDGNVYWVGNEYSYDDNSVYIYNINIE